MKRETPGKLDEADQEEIETLLREIELLLHHVIHRLREDDCRVFPDGADEPPQE